MKHYYLALLLITTFANSQIVAIPDAAFKSMLVNSSVSSQTAKNELGNFFAIDANANGEIEQSEALAVYWLEVYGSEITDLTGISSFVNLTELNCNHTGITSLDVGLSNLKVLNCAENLLQSLNVSQAANLEWLNCSLNALVSLDVSGLTHLKILNCYDNQLQSLNIDGVVGLEHLECQNNQFSSLDVGGHPVLGVVDCSNSDIASIGLENLPELWYLNCASNALTSLSVNQLPKINSLVCSHNQLTTLDVTGTKGLDLLTCSDNNLITLFIKNGFAEEELHLENNPGLAYICIDDADAVYIEYLIDQMQLPQCAINTYCSFTPGGIYYPITVTAKADFAMDGCTDADAVVPDMRIDVNDSNSAGSFFTNPNGVGFLPVQQGSYTITPVVPNFTASPSSVTVTFPDEFSSADLAFCITPDTPGLQDLNICVVPVIPTRPGFDATYKIIYKNNGSQIMSGQVNFTYDEAKIDFVSSDFALAGQSGGQLIWNYANLQPFEHREITVILNINSPAETPAVNIGDQLNFASSIEPIATDNVITDNNFGFKQLVVGSYDPNDKTCIEGDVVSPEIIGRFVHYLIRFENTGTFAAENIVVKDMIDTTKFDMISLVPIGGSHQFETRISGNKAEFIFQNINLPFDDAHNDGYVLFKIRTLPSLSVGDTFSNGAAIFFDYNYPVLTNAATTTIQLLGTPDFEFQSQFTLYPNPATDVLNIAAHHRLGARSVLVYNAIGQQVSTFIGAPIVTRFDVSSLSPGTYFVKVITDNGTAIAKFVKS